MEKRQGSIAAEDREEAQRRLQEIGCQILRASRDELYLGMRFMDVALSSFLYCMDSGVSPFGTDGNTIYFHPSQLGGLYRQNRILVNRGYLHMVLHCIFRHMTKQGMDGRYWNLSCDIAAEHIIDGCDQRAVRFSRSLLRRETYRKLEAEKKTLHAERIYKLLRQWELPQRDIERLESEFYVDDHRYWENQNPQKRPDPNLNKKWQEIDERMETDLETFSKEASEKSGSFLEQLKIQNKERYDYKEFLRKFSVLREELGVDPDTFDYHFYSYGLSLYGNMPLIEPQETKEVKKVKEFAVVIDTSMSCSGALVRKFLEETYSVLTEEDGFFKKVNVHMIQCDEEVQSDVKITSSEELKEYMEHLQLFGEGGTDFRPAFAYCTRMVEQGEFENLKGLIYFTDGYGIYPNKMPPYQTAFVFLEEEYKDADVPSWAMKLILTGEEWREKHGYKTGETGN
ncbi:metallopeptidase [Mediterraneibacter sp. NSJ-55]|uniref:Metallopeptidase n=1 Tax=Mediterraneibacter hominis TaxID=2763054 RepID=A0A923LK16_9FIRM|nr:VWA-like domain-containing protein [Mediterraneibacter hominis]MBC5689391.1 metallopeptidase [Mediterraneibacter hominis]